MMRYEMHVRRMDKIVRNGVLEGYVIGILFLKFDAQGRLVDDTYEEFIIETNTEMTEPQLMRAIRDKLGEVVVSPDPNIPGDTSKTRLQRMQENIDTPKVEYVSITGAKEVILQYEQESKAGQSITQPDGSAVRGR